TETSAPTGAAVPGTSPRILAITTFVLLLLVTRDGSSLPAGAAHVKGGAAGAAPGAARRRSASFGPNPLASGARHAETGSAPPARWRRGGPGARRSRPHPAARARTTAARRRPRTGRTPRRRARRPPYAHRHARGRAPHPGDGHSRRRRGRCPRVHRPAARCVVRRRGPRPLPRRAGGPGRACAVPPRP